MTVRWLNEPSRMLGTPQTLGYPPCTPAKDYPFQGEKPYRYVVQNGDGMEKIALQFGQPGGVAGWGALRTINQKEIATVELYGSCVLDLQPGQLLKIPGDWKDPDFATVQVACADSSLVYDKAQGKCVPKPSDKLPDCPEGQERDASGKCVSKAVVPAPCPEGQERDAFGNCMPKPLPTCPRGQVFDKKLNKCVTQPKQEASVSGFGIVALLAGAAAVGYLYWKDRQQTPADSFESFQTNPRRRRKF